MPCLRRRVNPYRLGIGVKVPKRVLDGVHRNKVGNAIIEQLGEIDRRRVAGDHDRALSQLTAEDGVKSLARGQNTQ